VDTFAPGPGGAQLHDLNPSPHHPTSGLFWTIPIPEGSVDANPGAGRATLQVSNAAVFDHGSIGNALVSGSGDPMIPSTVSFTVQWSGVNDRQNVKNSGDGHAGEFVFGSAQMEWTATAGIYTFQSAPLATSSSSFAVLGKERNGVFVNGGH
jgi:hypothetical protein